MTAIGRATTLGVMAMLVLTALAEASESRKERVRVMDVAPLTLRGLDFAPREQVSLTVSLGETRVERTLRAGSAGGFVTTFPKLRYDRCHGPLALLATGARGSRVAWKVVPLDCQDRTDS
jgi:hypothetical protein